MMDAAFWRLLLPFWQDDFLLETAEPDCARWVVLMQHGISMDFDGPKNPILQTLQTLQTRPVASSLQLGSGPSGPSGPSAPPPGQSPPLATLAALPTLWLFAILFFLHSLPISEPSCEARPHRSFCFFPDSSILSLLVNASPPFHGESHPDSETCGLSIVPLPRWILTNVASTEFGLWLATAITKQPHAFCSCLNQSFVLGSSLASVLISFRLVIFRYLSFGPRLRLLTF